MIRKVRQKGFYFEFDNKKCVHMACGNKIYSYLCI